MNYYDRYSDNARNDKKNNFDIAGFSDGFDTFEDDFDDFDSPAAKVNNTPQERQERYKAADVSGNSGYRADDRQYNARTAAGGFEMPVDDLYINRRQKPQFAEKPPVRSRCSDLFAPIDIVSNEPQQKNKSLVPFIVCLVLMCFVGSFLLSSGDMISSDSDVNDHLSANIDITIGVETMLVNVQNAALGLPQVYTLPMNESPAQPPIQENFSTYIDENGIEHQTYVDPTITVDCWRQRYKVNEYSIMAAVAKVKIAHPTQLRTALAGGQYGSTRLKPSTISKQVNAIIAINGDLYNYAGNNTVMIRQGTVYRDSPDSYLDVLFIDSHGDFKIIRGHEARETGYYPSDDRTIYQTISFGPPLVMDGEVVQFEMGGSYKTINYFYRNPRSAIGQLGPLEYLLVAVEGRSEESKGLTTNDFAYLMRDLGCIQAYNLDGGQSSMMIYRNKPFNHISNGSERTFSDIIYFGSAMPQEQK